ncbi:MAG: polysaccharide deacetylase family protein [Deltaproteobacteria bacterium]|nr:polysaccharide deacetylase family protein [Deltaproteobacteria bacterium]
MKQVLLMYHSISDSKTSSTYTLTKDAFKRHLDIIKRGGYSCATVEEYHDHLSAGVSMPEKSVLITFDDGHRSDYATALPLLKEYGFKATFFVTTDWIGRPEFMSPKELRALKEAGMSVHSHAQTHAFLDAMGQDAVTGELESSKKRLEEILGARVPYISFPGGRYNAMVLERARQAGYSAVFTSVPFSLKRHKDMFMIGRYAVKSTADEKDFLAVLKSNALERNSLKGVYYCKYFLRRSFGNGFYYSLWKKLNYK